MRRRIDPAMVWSMMRPFSPTRLWAVLLCLGVLQAGAQEASVGKAPPAGHGALQTIPALDVPRYMGVWYEIAKLPNHFQRKCIGWTRAEYSLNPDATVRVVNRCRTASGETDEAIGQARQVGPASSPKLEVRFAPAWLSFLPLVWGDYWVIDLDEGYQLAAVGEPGRQHLWILSRTPQVDPDVYRRLLERLAQQGFDVGRLELTRRD